MPSFGRRLKSAFHEYGQLCLGIDPSAETLRAWGLPDTADGAKQLGLACVEAASGVIGIIKPQVAYFERFGSAGFAALEDVLAKAKEAPLLVIADAKRGDIGSTMQGYAEAWLGADSTLRADALTVTPYLGTASLKETHAVARANQAAIFALAATSNPEGKVIQTSSAEGQSVAAQVVTAAARASQDFGDFGVVIGATNSLVQFGLGFLLNESLEIPILAPGFGAQGATLSSLGSIFGASSPWVIANVGREILKAGPDLLTQAIHRAKLEL